MELGNMIFGNSRGRHKIPREDRWHRRFTYLRELLEEQHGSDPAYGGEPFKNDTFEIRPYYWGDCPCGFAEAMRDWEDENDHRDDCYQVELHEAEVEANVRGEDGRLATNDELDYDEKRERRNEIYDRLTEKYDLPRRGCVVHCTCDYHDRRKAFAEEFGGHDEDCPTIQPNFYHKPTGLHVKWYKYPFRDSYINKDLDLDEWNAIVEDCIDSVRQRVKEEAKR